MAPAEGVGEDEGGTWDVLDSDGQLEGGSH